MTATAVSAEELELQDQVTRALESQGVLGKIKAQLRAAVFQAIHMTSGTNTSGVSGGALSARASQSSVLPTTALLQSYGADAPIALELVRNFLECLELDHTLAVFLAEAGLTDAGAKNASLEWRTPARLCERVCVASADETTPVLVKMLRASAGQRDSERNQRATEPRAAEPTPMGASSTVRDGGGFGRVEQEEKLSETERKPYSATTSIPDLPLPPAKTAVASPPAVNLPPRANGKDHDDQEEMDGSMAEEVASGSFEEESLAESGSLNDSRSEEFGKKPLGSQQTTGRPGRFGIQNEEQRGDHEHEEEEDDPSPSIASPPPVPAKLGPLPSLPGMGSTGSYARPALDEQRGDEEEVAARSDHEDEDDDLDDDAAAARLRSLEEKLKEMEAEDDTGVLQQLKETTLHGVEEVSSSLPLASTQNPTSRVDKGDEGDDDDNYGSDFEEEVEEMEEEEVASELSEDIASMSMLSESEDPAAVTTAKPEPLSALEQDTPVDSEDALNSYDYIEPVERH